MLSRKFAIPYGQVFLSLVKKVNKLFFCPAAIYSTIMSDIEYQKASC